MLFAAEVFIIHVALRLEVNNKKSYNLTPLKTILSFAPTPNLFFII
jgi:hypothetical protein